MWLRRFVPLCLVVGLLSPHASGAEEAMKKALSLIPADAVAFICVPSVKQLDADYQQAIVDLGLKEMLPPAMSSLVGAVKGQLPFLAGLDEEGPLVIVFMPAAMMFELQQKQVVLVPTKDPKAMLEGMGGQPGEEGLWNLNLMGQPFVGAAGEGRLILGQSAEVVKAVKADKSGITAKLKPEVVKALENLDLAVWLDAERFIPLFKPMIDMALNAMMQAQSAGSAFEAKSAELNKKQLDMLLTGASTFTLGIDLGKSGLVFRAATRCKPDSELARMWKVKSTEESLLKGLTGGDYIAAFGQNVDPEQTKANLETVDLLLALLEEKPSAEADAAGEPKPKNEHLEKLKKLAHEWLPLMTRMQGRADLLASGDAGLVGLAMIVTAADSKQWLDLAAQAVDVIKTLVKSHAEKGGEAAWQAEIGQLLDAISYARGAEEIAGHKVDHFRVDLAKLGEHLDEDDVENVLKIVGKDGLLLRLAAVDEKAVVVALGGGANYTERAVKAWKGKDDSLLSDAGIKLVAAAAPSPRYMEFYLAVDNIFTLVSNIAAALDEEPLPVRMADVKAPLGFIGTGGDGFVQIDAIFPTELLVAGKDVIMAMMAPPPGAEAAGTEEPATDEPAENEEE